MGPEILRHLLPLLLPPHHLRRLLMAESVKPSILWVMLLWLVGIATFRGWHWVDVEFGYVAAQKFFYVMRGVDSALLAMTLLVERKPHSVYVWVAVYSATEWVLTSVCGFSWYVLTKHSESPAAGGICDRDHSWTWVVIVLCMGILAVLWCFKIWGTHELKRH